ncbi:MAG: class I SAM-dependent methyltransferase [Verrucomicrobiia bacterium]
MNLFSLARLEGWGAAWRTLRHRCAERFYEWWFGVETTEEVKAEELGFNSVECHFYAATDYWSLFRVLARLRPDRRVDVFLDYGSGKGRALIIAAAQGGFRRIIGVEIAESLIAAARHNLEAARPRLKCQNITLEGAGADVFEVPVEVTHAYFCNPFHGQILRETFRRLQDSIRRRPRRVVIICRLPEQSAMERELPAYPFYRTRRVVEFHRALRYWIFEMDGSTPEV